MSKHATKKTNGTSTTPTATDLQAIWQDLLTVHTAIDASVSEDNASRVQVDAALGTLTRAMVALENHRLDLEDEDAGDEGDDDAAPAAPAPGTVLS